MDIKKSCAFCTASIDKLNALAQAVDKRLFLFAYYKPKAFPDKESAFVQFYAAVINLYGLFWDCGPFVMTPMLETWNSKSLFEQDSKGQPTPKSRKINSIMIKLRRNLKGLRNTVCHNNSIVYYYNQLNKDCADNFFVDLGFNPANLSPTDYQKCLDELCGQAVGLIDGIEYCLNWIKTIPQLQRDNIIDHWLEDGICHWYMSNKSGFNGYLEGLKQLHMANFNKKHLKLYDWLQANFGVSDNSGWLEKNGLLNLLRNVNACPKPALPIDVYKILAKDVHRFAMTNKN